jgi:hypothetical protein
MFAAVDGIARPSVLKESRRASYRNSLGVAYHDSILARRRECPIEKKTSAGHAGITG